MIAAAPAPIASLAPVDMPVSAGAWPCGRGLGRLAAVADRHRDPLRPLWAPAGRDVVELDPAVGSGRPDIGGKGGDGREDPAIDRDDRVAGGEAGLCRRR